MLIAKHEVTFHAHCYTWSEALCLGVMLYALCSYLYME